MLDVDGDKPNRKKFKRYPIGYFHIDIAEVQTAEGKLYLYVAIDRTSKFAFVQLVEKANRKTASAFLEALIAAVPYKIHTVLTDNGVQFTLPPRYRDGPTATYLTHMFDMRCRENDIDHRLTRIKHPWTNGQVERMNRTIKEATVKRYHYDDHAQLRQHLGDFISAYNFARRLKTLKGLTPYEYICTIWTQACGRWLNNRAENSHQPFRRREGAMARFRDIKTLQKFASAHASLHNHFNQDRHLNHRDIFKQNRSTALAEWRQLAA